jgi:hypothetical protein
MTHRREVEAILAGARAERAALLDALSPALRASLPVDATGITQAIDHLGEAAGLDLHGEQVQGHLTNSAVLHGRVFGRAPLSRDTVLAAFVDGARVRAETLAHLAEAVGGDALHADIDALLRRRPPAAAEPELRAAYAAQEDAALRIAAHLDEHSR